MPDDVGISPAPVPNSLLGSMLEMLASPSKLLLRDLISRGVADPELFPAPRTPAAAADDEDDKDFR